MTRPGHFAAFAVAMLLLAAAAIVSMLIGGAI